MGEVIGNINRDGDQKFFVVANKVASEKGEAAHSQPGVPSPALHVEYPNHAFL